MVFRPLAVAVLFLGLTGCLHRGECRSHGGPEWRELTTPHFRIRTDLDSESARLEAQHLEQQRTALLLYFPGIDPPVIDTVILDGVEEFNEYVPRFGGFTRFDQRGLLLVYSTYPLKRAWEMNTTAGHEFTHALTAFETPFAPVWYTEGLAMDEDWDVAFEQTLGKLKDLDVEANDYLKNGYYRVETSTLAQPVVTQIAERPMTDAEVHLARMAIREKAPVWQSSEERAALVQGELAKARVLAPASFEVRLLTAELTSDAAERKRLSSELLHEYPDRFEAWRQCGIAEENHADKAQDLLKALELSKGTDLPAFDELEQLPEERDRLTGLGTVDKLFRDHPWDSHCLAVTVNAAHARGDCADSVVRLERLLNRAKRGRDAAWTDSLMRKLFEWEADCDARGKGAGAH